MILIPEITTDNSYNSQNFRIQKNKYSKKNNRSIKSIELVLSGSVNNTSNNLTGIIKLIYSNSTLNEQTIEEIIINQSETKIIKLIEINQNFKYFRISYNIENVNTAKLWIYANIY